MAPWGVQTGVPHVRIFGYGISETHVPKTGHGAHDSDGMLKKQITLIRANNKPVEVNLTAAPQAGAG